MLKKQRPKITLKGGAVLCICTFILCLIGAIALFVTNNSVGGIICIISGIIFLIPAIIYYEKKYKPQYEAQNRIKAYSDMVDALIKDLDIVCSDEIKDKTKQDANEYIYVLSKEEIEERRNNPLLFYNPIRSSMCCVETEKDLIVLLQAILIYHYSNFRSYIEQIRIDNNIPQIQYGAVKKSVFLLISDHLKKETNEPMNFDNEELITSIKNILENNIKSEIPHTPFHK